MFPCRHHCSGLLVRAVSRNSDLRRRHTQMNRIGEGIVEGTVNSSLEESNKVRFKVLHHTDGPAELLTMKGTSTAVLKSSQLKKSHEMTSLPSHYLDFPYILYRPLVVTVNCIFTKLPFELPYQLMSRT